MDGGGRRGGGRGLLASSSSRSISPRGGKRRVWESRRCCRRFHFSGLDAEAAHAALGLLFHLGGWEGGAAGGGFCCGCCWNGKRRERVAVVDVSFCKREQTTGEIFLSNREGVFFPQLRRLSLSLSLYASLQRKLTDDSGDDVDLPCVPHCFFRMCRESVHGVRMSKKKANVRRVEDAPSAFSCS